MTPQFFYFFQAAGGLDLLAAAGLAEAAKTCLAVTLVGKDEGGPHGWGGLVCHRGLSTTLPAIEWHEVRTDELWIGWEVGKKPGPDDLRRSRGLVLNPPGAVVRLRDGHGWRVPLVLPADNDSCRSGLACVPTIVSGTGLIGYRLSPEGQALHDAALPFLRGFLGQEPTPDMDATVRFCALLLSWWQAVGLDEVLALELLDADVADLLIGYALDGAERVKRALPESVRAQIGPEWNWEAARVFGQGNRGEAESAEHAEELTRFCSANSADLCASAVSQKEGPAHG